MLEMNDMIKFGTITVMPVFGELAGRTMNRGIERFGLY